MVKKALLIGINYYNVPGATLNGCINDITNMKNVLVTNYGYTENDIVMLRDDSTSYRQPTAQNIVGWLNALIAISPQCEEVFFHYSGHGSSIRDTNGDERTGLDSVIVPVDFQSVGVIVDDLIFSLVKNSKCRTMLLFDSCNSGSVCDLIWSYEYTGGNNYKRSQINNFEVSNKNIYCISGCKDTQTSADIYDSEDKQYEGAFTDSFIRSLKNNNYSGSLLKIYKDTCAILSIKGYTQKPLLSSTSPNITYSIQKKPASKYTMLFDGVGGFPTLSVGEPSSRKSIESNRNFVDSRSIVKMHVSKKPSIKMSLLF